jgi:hypothetical protein
VAAGAAIGPGVSHVDTPIPGPAPLHTGWGRKAEVVL